MLNSFSRTTRNRNLLTLLTIKDGGLSSVRYNLFHLLPTVNTNTCLCGRILKANDDSLKKNATYSQPFRIHSSLSDSRRQKVMLETSTPKIVIGKLPTLEEKVLPDEKNAELDNFKSKILELRDSVDPYAKLMRVDKPIGAWLLYWPCSWSIALASIAGSVPLSVATYNLGLFLAGSFIMRGAGCTINDLWDRDIDGKVERTKDRPLVSGAITEKQAIVFLAGQLSIGLLILLQLNWYSVVLGASSMLLVVSYPLAKRFTNYPQLFLGATFNWGALLGYSAVQGSILASVCLPLYAGALCWTVVYDTIYAHQDKYDDARIGIKSTALTFGPRTRGALALWGCGAASGLACAGLAVDLGAPYFAALGLATAHVARQIYTLDTENPSDCAFKFKSNSLVGLIIFLGIIAGGWDRYRKDETSKNIDSSEILNEQ